MNIFIVTSILVTIGLILQISLVYTSSKLNKKIVVPIDQPRVHRAKITSDVTRVRIIGWSAMFVWVWVMLCNGYLYSNGHTSSVYELVFGLALPTFIVLGTARILFNQDRIIELRTINDDVS